MGPRLVVLSRSAILSWRRGVSAMPAKGEKGESGNEYGGHLERTYLPLRHALKIAQGRQAAENPHEFGVFWDLRRSSGQQLAPPEGCAMRAIRRSPLTED